VRRNSNFYVAHPPLSSLRSRCLPLHHEPPTRDWAWAESKGAVLWVNRGVQGRRHRNLRAFWHVAGWIQDCRIFLAYAFD
jgi:hypothetical protein